MEKPPSRPVLAPLLKGYLLVKSAQAAPEESLSVPQRPPDTGLGPLHLCSRPHAAPPHGMITMLMSWWED